MFKIIYSRFCFATRHEYQGKLPKNKLIAQQRLKTTRNLDQEGKIKKQQPVNTVLGITLLKVAGVIIPLHNSLLYSTQESHYSTQEVAGVIKISS